MTENESTVSGMWTPKRWVAVLLAFISAPIGFLYLGQKRWAWFYLLLSVGLAFLRFGVLSKYTNDEVLWLFLLTPLTAMTHAYWLAPRIKEIRKWYSRWYGLAGIFMLFFIPFLTMRVFFYENYRIPAGSMLPTLQVGQLIHVKKWGCGNYQFWNIQFLKTERNDSCPIKHGDLIVFDFPMNPKDKYIKRVMAMGGDHIRIDDKQVWLNGQLLPAEWMRQEDSHAYWLETLGDMQYQVIHIDGREVPFRHVDVTVPAGHLFVMGDNRDNSHDSRSWGVVPIDHVVGVVF
ncbi:signal peptidase I [Marinicella meishanensis]|uniref:signal peptidase I n=1 Tax=Marinicella meishanensis TaxID=2873263 RepID=UPI001CC1789B|nr:signal peptidase I [Marinicella sp. NBU2979]